MPRSPDPGHPCNLPRSFERDLGPANRCRGSGAKAFVSERVQKSASHVGSGLRLWRLSGYSRSLWFRSRAAVSRRPGGVSPGTPEVYDQPLFLRTLSRFARVLPSRYDLATVLSELTESITAVLGLCGSWVTLADDEQLRFMAAVSQALAELERDHEQLHPFPCRDAYPTGEVLTVTDVRRSPPANRSSRLPPPAFPWPGSPGSRCGWTTRSLAP
jgi:hypothetical protein